MRKTTNKESANEELCKITVRKNTRTRCSSMCVRLSSGTCLLSSRRLIMKKVLLVIALLGSASCSNTVTQHEISLATKVCQGRGDFVQIEKSPLWLTKVLCADNSAITLKVTWAAK